MPDETVEKVLRFEIERSGDTSVVRCHGRLIAGVADELYQAVKPLFAETKHVVIDLAELTYVDSMGLGTLVRLYVHARQEGGRVTLEHLGKQVRNVLSLTNLLGVFGSAESDGIGMH